MAAHVIATQSNHVWQHNPTLLRGNVLHQLQSLDPAAMRFCLPLHARAPLHHGLGRCNVIEALAGLVQIKDVRIISLSCIRHRSVEHYACGFCTDAQAARDAMVRPGSSPARRAC